MEEDDLHFENQARRDPLLGAVEKISDALEGHSPAEFEPDALQQMVRLARSITHQLRARLQHSLLQGIDYDEGLNYDEMERRARLAEAAISHSEQRYRLAIEPYKEEEWATLAKTLEEFRNLISKTVSSVMDVKRRSAPKYFEKAPVTALEPYDGAAIAAGEHSIQDEVRQHPILSNVESIIDAIEGRTAAEFDPAALQRIQTRARFLVVNILQGGRQLEENPSLIDYSYMRLCFALRGYDTDTHSELFELERILQEIRDRIAQEAGVVDKELVEPKKSTALVPYDGLVPAARYHPVFGAVMELCSTLKRINTETLKGYRPEVILRTIRQVLQDVTHVLLVVRADAYDNREQSQVDRSGDSESIFEERRQLGWNARFLEHINDRYESSIARFEGTRIDYIELHELGNALHRLIYHVHLAIARNEHIQRQFRLKTAMQLASDYKVKPGRRDNSWKLF